MLHAPVALSGCPARRGPSRHDSQATSPRPGPGRLRQGRGPEGQDPCTRDRYVRSAGARGCDPLGRPDYSERVGQGAEAQLVETAAVAAIISAAALDPDP